VGTRYGLQWAPDAGTVAPGRTVEFTLTTLRDAATTLGEALDARMDMDGNFLRVELRGAYPTRITAIVNAVAQRYVQVYADLKRQKVIELTKILGEQVQHSQDNLRNAEAALQRFREETITLPSDRAAAGASVAGAGGGPIGTGRPAGTRRCSGCWGRSRRCSVRRSRGWRARSPVSLRGRNRSWAVGSMPTRVVCGRSRGAPSKKRGSAGTRASRK